MMKKPYSSADIIDFQYFPESNLLINLNSFKTVSRADHIMKVTYFIEIIEKIQPRFVLILGNSTNLRFDEQLEKWIRQALIPQLSKTRVEKLAFVVDDMDEAQPAIPIGPIEFEIGIFPSEDKARKWLNYPA